MFRRIAEPYPKNPIGSLVEKDGYLMDDQRNIYEIRGNEYYKIGFDNDFFDEKTIGRFINDAGAASFGVVVFNLLFPARSQRQNSGEERAVVMAIRFALGLAFLYSAFVGWLVGKLLARYSQFFADFSEKHRILRVFFPATWFLPEPGIFLKTVQLLYLGLYPSLVFLVIGIPGGLADSQNGIFQILVLFGSLGTLVGLWGLLANLSATVLGLKLYKK